MKRLDCEPYAGRYALAGVCELAACPEMAWDAAIRFMDALAQALEYQAAGLSVFSLPYGEKAANERWGHWRDQQPTEAELEAMFANGLVNTAVAYGPASGNLIGLDCDSPKRFAEGSALVQGLGIETWTVRRHECGDDHDGGGLFLFRTTERVQGSNRTEMDVMTNKYGLIPHSRHPGGVDYYTAAGGPQYIFVLPSLDLLSPWVELRPWTPPTTLENTEAAAVIPYRPGEMSRKARHILKGNWQRYEYPTRSEAEQALLCSLIRYGYDFEACLSLFREKPAAGKFREMDLRNPKAAEAWLRHSYSKAMQWVIENPGDEWKTVQQLRGWALDRPWPGRTGTTDRAVYLAHLQIVETCCRQPYAASCRDLAEKAGIGHQTATNAMKRLMDAGLIELVEGASYSLANTYRLTMLDTLESAEMDTLSLVKPTNVIECPSMHISHDAFRWSGIGKPGAEIWAALCHYGELTEKRLIEITGRHRTTIQRKLPRMASLGMVEPLGDGAWRALPDVDLDQVAKDLGTYGKGEAQRERHNRQRAQRDQMFSRS